MSESMKYCVPLRARPCAAVRTRQPGTGDLLAGACTSCAPAPVVQTQCNVVSLVPQYRDGDADRI